MQELNELNCYYVLGDPIGIESRQTAIKIIYSDGEYDLITYNGMATYTCERQYQNYKGHRYFDKEEFEAFLQKYIGDETQSSD